MCGRKLKVGLLFVLVTVLTIGVFSGQAANAQPKYKFFYVSHMGPADPNSNWFSVGIKRFEERYSDVSVEYLVPPSPTPKDQLQMLKTAIAMGPDGLIVSMTAPEMFDATLRDAIKKGIPVVAFNIADPRPQDERIPYLTYVGGDEYLTGYRLGKRYLELRGKPTKVAVFQFNPAHVGLEARAEGMKDVMKEVGVPTEKVALSPDAGESMSVMTSYLTANPEVDVVFDVTTYGEPWTVSVLKKLGKEDKVDIIGVDASPTSLEGVKEGIIVATHSQGFYLQAYLPMTILYMYNEYGLAPATDVLTGPVVIDKTNVDKFIEMVKRIFGEETYNKLVAWR